MKGILSPLGLDMLVLLLGIEHAPYQLTSILLKQVNGLRNPMYGPPQARAAFQDSVALLARLEDAGQAAWASTSTKDETFALVIHDYAPGNRGIVRDLLQEWDLPASLVQGVGHRPAGEPGFRTGNGAPSSTCRRARSTT